MLPIRYLIITSLLCCPPLSADSDQYLSLIGIYQDKTFESERLQNMQWLDNGNAYTHVEDSIAGEIIVRYTTLNGKRKLLFKAQDLPPAAGGETAKITDYRLSEDGKRLLIFTNTQNHWRHRPSGDYWLVELAIGKKTKLGDNTQAGNLYFATFSPDGNQVAYMYRHNLYVQNLHNSHITQLTHDGSDTLVNGALDWAYEEEFFLRDGGFRWRPDSSAIAYWQVDMQGVGIFNLINNTDSLYPELMPLHYPKAGTPNAAVRIGVVKLNDPKTTWMRIEGDPRNHYLARMQWTPHTQQLAIQQLNRTQNTLKLLLANPDNGNIKTVLQETSDTWLDTVDDNVWFDQDRRFTWLSDQDGWLRAYIYSADGKLLHTLSPPEQDIMAVSHINPESGWLYYLASPDNATQRYLYRVPLDGSVRAQRVTPAAQIGTHRYNISPNQGWALQHYSRFDTPTTTTLIALPEHRSQRSLVDNQNLKDKLTRLQPTPHTFFKITTPDNITMDGWMIKPPFFDPNKKYPVIFYVYAEPWHQTVTDSWGGEHTLWHRLLAQQGYLVISIDNRGTPAPKGRPWRKAIYGKLGTLTSADQAAAAEIITAWDFVDASRVGVWGRSGGGSHTLNAMFRYPDIYKVGISIAPVPDLLLYDTIYQERYTGVPPQDLDNYIKGSAITYAQQLKGELLLIHGTGDDNVHYQGTEKLINKLIEHNLPFNLLAYPNRAHGIREGKNTQLHKRSAMLRFFRQHLPTEATTP